MSLCLLFPGQGSQHDGMFAQSWAGWRPGIADTLREVVGLDPARLTSEEMHRNTIAQPAIVAHELASWLDLDPVLPADTLVLGYSVGEIAACCAAGVMEPAAAIRLAAVRADLMDRAAPPGSGLLAVRGLSLDTIRSLAVELAIEVAIENGPDHAVLGGSGRALDVAENVFRASGARTVKRLPVSISSHTSSLSRAADPFRTVLAATLHRGPSKTFISGVWARPLYDCDAIIESLTRQLHTPLRFADALRVAKECGATCFLELGPGDGLTQIVSDNLPDMAARPLHLFRSTGGAKTWIERHCP